MAGKPQKRFEASFQSDIQASKDAGMDAHISKPFNVQELLKILQAKIQKEAD